VLVYYIYFASVRCNVCDTTLELFQTNEMRADIISSYNLNNFEMINKSFTYDARSLVTFPFDVKFNCESHGVLEYLDNGTVCSVYISIS